VPAFQTAARVVGIETTASASARIGMHLNIYRSVRRVGG
jgi:hypothetical protein